MYDICFFLTILSILTLYYYFAQIHSTVKKRWLEGDPEIVATMQEVAELAEQGKKALEDKDYLQLATLMDRNFDLRRF